MAETLALYASKGGIGKTSIAGNLGATLADMGYRVLLVDADIQQSLSNFFLVIEPAEKGLRQLIQDQQRPDYDPLECISRTDIDNLDLVVSNDFDKSLSHWIRQSSSRFQALRVALARLDDHYDYIIIDTQGSDGTGDLQELAVRAADKLLIPLVPDALVLREFAANTLALLDRLRPFDVADTMNAIPVPHVGIYKVERTRSHTVYVEGIRQMFVDYAADGRIHPLTTEIPKKVAYNDAQSGEHKIPVHRFDSKRESANQVLPCAYESMTALAHELFPETVSRKPRFSADDPLPVDASSDMAEAELTREETGTSITSGEVVS